MSHQPSDIGKRLETLPRKVRMPFESLMASGQIGPECVSDVLDACEIAENQPQWALGFAIGYLHMRSNNVPVQDVIRMSRAQGRKVNLSWSPKRWKQEHDRLSRRLGLLRLAGENVEYDVTSCEALLPAGFNGFLIRSSRRLGMEGLRQRHCVANYHSMIQSGHCAVASVFAEGKRWTVQLNKQDSEDHPIRVGQIRTRLNALPSGKERESVFSALGIEDRSQTQGRVSGYGAEHHYMENLQRILPTLRTCGVETVEVSFCGSGDSGSIDHVSYVPDDFDSDATNVAIMSVTRHYEVGGWVEESDLQLKPITDAIETVTYDYLEETGVNWYDNDGGFGTLEIDVASGAVTLDVSASFTESETVFNRTRDIETGDEL